MIKKKKKKKKRKREKREGKKIVTFANWKGTRDKREEKARGRDALVSVPRSRGARIHAPEEDASGHVSF